MKQCQNIISRIDIETREMSKDERSQVRQLLKGRQLKLKELANELKWARNQQFVPAEDSLNVQNEEEKYEDLDEMNEDEVIGYARKIQSEDHEILDRVIIDVDQTKDQAENVAQKVANQTGQIVRIDNKLDVIDDELERAKRVLKVMLRRVMTDKIIWSLIGLIFIAVGIITLQNAGVI